MKNKEKLRILGLLNCSTMADPKSHFFQPLLPGFHNHLNIPVAFFKQHIEGRNENKTAKLRSYLSHRTWGVKMVGRRFTCGWEDFAVDHDLRIGDIIVFRYDGDLVFHVTGFGPSDCNLQYAPFCPDDDHSNEDNIGNVSRVKKVGKNPKTEAESLSDSTCFTASVTVADLHADRLYLPRKFVMSNGLNERRGKILLTDEWRRSWTLDLQHKTSSGRVYVRRGWRGFCFSNGLQVGSLFTLKLVRNWPTSALLLSPPESSNNSSSAEECSEGKEEKSHSTKRSSKHRSRSGGCSKRKENKTPSSSPRQNQFLILTLTLMILRNGWLRLPIRFTRVNGINKPGKITLLDKYGVAWPTTLWMEKKRGTMALGKGLRSFCEANGMKKGESFMLELVWKDTTPILKFCSKIHCDTESVERETVARAAYQPEDALQQKMAAEKSLIQNETKTRKRVRVGGLIPDPSRGKRSKHQENGCRHATSVRRTAENPRHTQSFCVSDQMAKSKQSNCEALTTPEVLVKEEQSLGASGCEFGAFDFSDSRNLSRKKKVKCDPKTEAESSSDHSCFVASVTASNLRTDTLSIPISFARSNGLNNRCCEIVLRDDGGRSWTSDLRLKKLSGRVYIRRGWRSFCRTSGLNPGDLVMLKLVQNGTTPVLGLSPTKSGCVEECLEKTSTGMRRASSLPTKNLFVTLTPTPCSLRRNLLRLPIPFTRGNGIEKPMKITLLDKDGVAWPTNLRLESGSGIMSLRKGLRGFYEANGVKAGDSFVLELIRDHDDRTPIFKFCSKIRG